MQNEEGQNMDLYIPRKCSATNRLITSKDHASVQINVGHLDELGRYTGTFSTFALCGFVRAQTWRKQCGVCPAACRLAQGPSIGTVTEKASLVACRLTGSWLLVDPITKLFIGDADSALDRLWQKKKAEVRQ
ncbi:hypothetical protein Gotur_022547 [Gossypium turneri]